MTLNRTQMMLRPDQLAALAKISAKTGAPMAAIVRMALDAYLKKSKEA